MSFGYKLCPIPHLWFSYSLVEMSYRKRLHTQPYKAAINKPLIRQTVILIFNVNWWSGYYKKSCKTTITQYNETNKTIPCPCRGGAAGNYAEKCA